MGSWLSRLSPYKTPIKKTFECILSWTNATLPPEETLDDTIIGMIDNVIDQIIPDPTPPD